MLNRRAYVAPHQTDEFIEMCVRAREATRPDDTATVPPRSATPEPRTEPCPECGTPCFVERHKLHVHYTPARSVPQSEPEGLDVEQIVRAALRVVDQETPLAVGEPLIQRAIRYATNRARLTGGGLG